MYGYIVKHYFYEPQKCIKVGLNVYNEKLHVNITLHDSTKSIFTHLTLVTSQSSLELHDQILGSSVLYSS